MKWYSMHYFLFYSFQQINIETGIFYTTILTLPWWEAAELCMKVKHHGRT